MGGQPPQQALPPLVVVQHRQIGVGQIGAPAVDHLGDPRAIGVGGQPQGAAQALFDRGVAAGPRENEGDGRQQPLAVQRGDDVGARRWAIQTGPAMPTTRTTPSRLPVDQPIGLAAMGDVTDQFGVHPVPSTRSLSPAVVVEQVEQPLAHQHVLPERDRSVLVDHDGGVTAHGLDPATELLGVADRRREADQANLLGQVQDDLLPHRTAHPVGQEVDLVHHHVGQRTQCFRPGVEHVAQHLGGHHHHRRVTVDRLVPGEQPDPLGPVPAHQVIVFLVAQRLDRRGVEALLSRLERQVHRELPHHGFARTGGRAHQHTVTAFQGRARLLLERIEPECQFSGEIGQLRVGLR